MFETPERPDLNSILDASALADLHAAATADEAQITAAIALNTEKGIGTADDLKDLKAALAEVREFGAAVVAAHNELTAPAEDSAIPSLDGPAKVTEVEEGEVEAPTVEVEADPEPAAAEIVEPSADVEPVVEPVTDEAIAELIASSPSPDEDVVAPAETPEVVSERPLAKLTAAIQDSSGTIKDGDELHSLKDVHAVLKAAHQQNGNRVFGLRMRMWPEGTEALTADAERNEVLISGFDPEGAISRAAVRNHLGCDPCAAPVLNASPFCFRAGSPLRDSMNQQMITDCEVKTEEPTDPGPTMFFDYTEGWCDPCDESVYTPRGLVNPDTGYDENGDLIIDPDTGVPPVGNVIPARLEDGSRNPDAIKPVQYGLPEIKEVTHQPTTWGWAREFDRGDFRCNPRGVELALQHDQFNAANRGEGQLQHRMIRHAIEADKSVIADECCINATADLGHVLTNVFAELEADRNIDLSGILDSVAYRRGLREWLAASDSARAFGSSARTFDGLISDFGVTNQTELLVPASGVADPFARSGEFDANAPASREFKCDDGRTKTFDLIFYDRQNNIAGTGETVNIGFGEPFADWELARHNAFGQLHEQTELWIPHGCCPVAHVRVTLTDTGGLTAGFINPGFCATITEEG